jgi:hypothetical protein
MKNTDCFLIAHVELHKARFSNGEDIGIEFKNEIDAWTKMEVHFRHQIQNPRKRTLKGKQDLNTLIYSFRQKLE